MIRSKYCSLFNVLVLSCTIYMSPSSPVFSEEIVRNVKSNQVPREIIKSGFNKFIRERWTNAKSYGAQIVIDPPGGVVDKALRMELRYGDCGQERKWNDCAHNNERIEFAKYNAFRSGQRTSYEWSMFFAPGFSSRGAGQVIVTQFSMMGANSHPFQFSVRNGSLVALKRVESTDWNYESLVKRIISSRSLTGRWHDIKVDAKWSSGADGHFFVWVNGEMAYQWRGRTLGVGNTGSIKIGMYRQKVTSKAPTLIMYLANLSE